MQPNSPVASPRMPASTTQAGLPKHQTHSSVFSVPSCSNRYSHTSAQNASEVGPDSKPDWPNSPSRPLQHPAEPFTVSTDPEIAEVKLTRLTSQALRAVDPLADASCTSLSSPSDTLPGEEHLRCSWQVSGDTAALAVYCSGSVNCSGSLPAASSSCRLSHSQLPGSFAPTSPTSHLSHPLATVPSNSLLKEPEESSIGDIMRYASTLEAGTTSSFLAPSTIGNAATATPTLASTTPDTSTRSIAVEFHQLHVREADAKATAAAAAAAVASIASPRCVSPATVVTIPSDQSKQQPRWLAVSQSQLSRDASRASAAESARTAGPVCEGDEGGFDDEDDWGDFGDFEEPSVAMEASTAAQTTESHASPVVALDTSGTADEPTDSNPNAVVASNTPEKLQETEFSGVAIGGAAESDETAAGEGAQVADAGEVAETPVATVSDAAAPPVVPQPAVEETAPAVRRFLDALAAVAAPPVATSVDTNLPAASTAAGPFSFPLPDPAAELASLAGSPEASAAPVAMQADADTPTPAESSHAAPADGASETSVIAPVATANASNSAEAEEAATPTSTSADTTYIDGGRMHRDAVLRLLGLPADQPPADADTGTGACMRNSTTRTTPAAPESTTTSTAAQPQACMGGAEIGPGANSLDDVAPCQGVEGEAGEAQDERQWLQGSLSRGASLSLEERLQVAHIRPALSGAPSSAIDEMASGVGGEVASGAPSAGVSPRHASAMALSMSASDPFSAGAQPCSPGVHSPSAQQHVHMSDEGEVVDFAEVDTHAAGVVTGSLHIDENFLADLPVSGSPIAEATEVTVTTPREEGAIATANDDACTACVGTPEVASGGDEEQACRDTGDDVAERKGEEEEPSSPQVLRGAQGGVAIDQGIIVPDFDAAGLKTPDFESPDKELKTPQSPKSSGVLDSLAEKLPDLSAVLSPVIQHSRRSPGHTPR